jgi:hypothetical protein
LETEQKLNAIPSLENLNTPTPTDLFSQISVPIENKIEYEKVKPVRVVSENGNTDEVEKIVFFYKNGTFKIYIPDSF